MGCKELEPWFPALYKQDHTWNPDLQVRRETAPGWGPRVACSPHKAT